MSDRAVDILFYALVILLPLSALIARRPPLKQTLVSIAAWVGIFALGVIVVSQRDRVTALFQSQMVEGRATRIAMAPDGHFWADATINGVARRMLIDSGATTTAISVATAKATGLDTDESPFPVVLNTANGSITARTASADRVAVGGIETRDLNVVVSAAFGGTDIIGMNFLSRLGSWRVEGRTLILDPRPPPT